MNRLVPTLLFLALGLLLVGGAAEAQGPPPMSSNATVFATGLNSPRGLKFGPDGNLYVAEAGTGGSASTVGKCPQVPAPAGPYTGGHTGRVSKVGPDGSRTTVVDGLPSSQISPAAGSFIQGMEDVEFIGTSLYALSSGGGCSHGLPDNPTEIIRVNADGSITHQANLSDFLAYHPVAHPNPADFEPDGTWYSLAHLGSDLFAVEPNHGEVDKVTPGNPVVSRLIDVSAVYGHEVPTSMVVGPDGNFYVGNLDLFPVTTGQARIYQITPSGQISIFATGLTAVLGVAFDSRGRLYALETSAGVTDPKGPPIAAFTGRVVRVTNGTLQPVATGLMFPTAMTFGPDGMLYVSNFGFGGKPGDGQIVKVDVNAPATTPSPASPSSTPTAPRLPTSLPNTGDALLPIALIVSASLAVGGWLARRKGRAG